MKARAWLFAFLGMLGCAEDLRGRLRNDGKSKEARIVTQAIDDEVFATRIDASEPGVWIYLRFDTSEEVQPSDPLTSTEWDLGLSRFNIKLNGGISGSAGVDACGTTTTFDDVTSPDACATYTTDAEDGDDVNSDPDYVLGAWYDYDSATHVLSPKPFTYVIRTATSGTIKLAMQDYYSDAGSSGHPSFLWARLASPQE